MCMYPADMSTFSDFQFRRFSYYLMHFSLCSRLSALFRKLSVGRVIKAAKDEVPSYVYKDNGDGKHNSRDERATQDHNK